MKVRPVAVALDRELAGSIRAGSICVPPQPGQSPSPASGSPIRHGFASAATTEAHQGVAVHRDLETAAEGGSVDRGDGGAGQSQAIR